MKRALATSAGALAITAAIVLSGCAKTAHTQQQQGQADQGPAWKLVYSAQCAQADDTSCVGRYGFAVTANHTWEVGPGPAGQLKSGQIADADFAELEQAVTANGGLSALKAGCAASTDDSTDEVAPAAKIVLVQHTKQTELCAREGNASTPAQVVEVLSKLADKYYPTPFPDACEDASSALSALYAPLKSCHSDAECVYVTPGFNAISADSPQWVVTDSCTVTTPLVVANSTALASGQQQLFDAYNKAMVACGNRNFRSDCSAYSGFMSSAGAPVCQQNTCVVSPSAVIEH